MSLNLPYILKKKKANLKTFFFFKCWLIIGNA